MESIYTELALHGIKMSVLRVIMSFSPYLRSAMVRFPFLNLPKDSKNKTKKNGFALVLGGLQWVGQICPHLVLNVTLEAWQDKG